MSRAADLAAAIELLLDEYEAFRLNPQPWVPDADAVTHRWNEVARLSRLAGFGEPAVLAEAGLVLRYPGQPEPIRNREADELWISKLRALQQKARLADTSSPDASVPTLAQQGAAAAAPPVQSAKGQKRSTARGDARIKLIAALTAYHQYDDGGCQNFDPVGSNKLAKMAAVSNDSASQFFKGEFGSHTGYQTACRDKYRLLRKLEELNEGSSARRTFGRTPPGEGRDTEE
jgi:hypothetical protein